MSGSLEIETKVVESAEFLKLLKQFKEFRIKFKTDNSAPFNYFYPIISKKELRWFVRSHKAIVSCEIHYNSKVQKPLNDIVYILKMRSTILDKE